MASRDPTKKSFSNMDEILDIILNDESDLEIDLGEDFEDVDADSDWEYEAEAPNAAENLVKSVQPENYVVDNDILASTPERNYDMQVSIPSLQEEEAAIPEISEDESIEEESSSSSSSSDEYQEQERITDDNKDVPLASVTRRVRTRGGNNNPSKFIRNNEGRRGGVARRRGGASVRTRGGGVQCGSRRVGAQGRSVPVRGRGRQQNNGQQWEWQPVDSSLVENIEENDCFPFQETEGLKIRMGEHKSALDYIELYLTDNIMQHIVDETNRFASDYLRDNPEKANNSYTGFWEEVTISEMKNFFGLVLLMGIIHKPALSDYWSTDDLYTTPIFSRSMKRDRFYLILKFLHFNDNNDPNYNKNDENRDRLHKLRPFIEMIRERCQKVYYPGKHLSVDESLVLFKGRLHFKQFIRTKRARFGIKLYELTTSEGITLDFLVYCGKGMFFNDDINSDMPSTERIPATLMRPYLNKGHILYTDNYYTSPSLATFFLQNSTHLCGTVRTNRRFYCKDIINVQLEKGTAAFYKASHDNRIMASKYRAIKDKTGNQQKVVYLLSTCHPPHMIEIGKNHNDVQVFKPTMVKAYNTHMGGVDRVDQQLHGIQSLRKAYKWYKKLAIRIIMQVSLNGFKVFQHCNPDSNTTFLSFLHEAITLLIVQTPDVPRPIDPTTGDLIDRLTGRHFPSMKEPNQGAKDQRPSKKCRVCYARGIKAKKGGPLKTVYICRFCPSQPGLHPDTCFELYHTALDFSK